MNAPRKVTWRTETNRWLVLLLCLTTLSVARADGDSPRIVVIDSGTPTKALLAKPGTYLGEAFVFSEDHAGDVPVRVGVWEAGEGRSVIEKFPFTEYVLMVSGSVRIIEKDGSSRTFVAGDTFVIPRGWSGVWDVQKRMKKQIVRVGEADQ